LVRSLDCSAGAAQKFMAAWACGDDSVAAHQTVSSTAVRNPPNPDGAAVRMRRIGIMDTCCTLRDSFGGGIGVRC
jgi:hypothetical protein